MEYIEIILKDINKNNLNKIIGESIKFEKDSIISSHFFDKKNNKDIEYQDINNFEDILCDSGAGDLFLEKVEMGIELEKVVIVITYDEDTADITLNFCEDQFMRDMNPSLSESIKRLFQTLLEIQNKYNVNNIVVGYEPATDDDMMILELDQNHIKKYNKDIFRSLFAQSLYTVLGDIN